MMQLTATLALTRKFHKVIVVYNIEIAHENVSYGNVYCSKNLQSEY